jgi:hypothetical protein
LTGQGLGRRESKPVTPGPARAFLKTRRWINRRSNTSSRSERACCRRDLPFAPRHRTTNGTTTSARVVPQIFRQR